MLTSTHSFLVNKNNLKDYKIEEQSLPEIQEGEALLKVEKYMFSSNNITYGVIGHRFRYWEFYPVNETYGIIPVWGYTRVVESKHEGLQKGDVFHGYLPMSQYFKVKVEKASEQGFVDASSHRVELPKIYNYYTNSNTELEKQNDFLNYLLVTRTTFSTSFLLYDYISKANFFDAKQIILTSASSKTALGLAHLLHKNKSNDNKEIIGLTSARNVEFVEKTGYYDKVIKYGDAIEVIDNQSSIIIDMAGSATLLHKLADYLGDGFKQAVQVGLTDWESERVEKKLPNAAVFFAPSQVQILFKEHGKAKAMQIIMSEMMDFTATIQKHLSIEYTNNMDEVGLLFEKFLNGNIEPNKGYIVEV